MNLRRHFISLLVIILLAGFAIAVDYPGGPKIFGEKPTVHQGLDLRGGTHLVYEADLAKIDSASKQKALTSVTDILDRRINALGVSEPVMQTIKINNADGVLIELPGIQNIDDAVKLIGQTAQLKFMTIDGQVVVEGSDLKRSTVSLDPAGKAGHNGQVNLEFNPDGAKKFADATTANVGKQIAIILDDQVISAPTVQTAITDGSAVINGDFTIDQAKQLSIALNSGALPVPLKLVEQRNVGATLGDAPLKQAAVAGLLGFLAVAIFMIFLYRLPGLLAVLALMLYSTFTLALFKLIPVTLTLAGIAGFILSIGMAVDANILIFERMREEQRRGKSLPVALEDGFKRAWNSIRDSNASSIITALILIWFGTGSIRGFALTLLIGILVSLFTAITVTRTFLRLLVSSKAASRWANLTRVQGATV